MIMGWRSSDTSTVVPRFVAIARDVAVAYLAKQAAALAQTAEGTPAESCLDEVGVGRANADCDFEKHAVGTG
jgi:hypothetical protein